jgi:hypothetical protein
MAKQQSKLLTLYDNVVLREKLGKALDEDISYSDIILMCKGYGIDISESSISRYSALRTKATKSGQDLRELLDSDTNKTLNNIKKKQVKHNGVAKKQEPELVKEETYSTEVMLERLIKNGYTTMTTENTNIAPKDWIAMVKLYTQINGNNNHGLTTEGLQQLRLLQLAMNQATVNAITKYVPADKREEVIKTIKEEEIKQYKQLDTSEQGRALLKALDIGNLEDK